jgi:hypothetical protein
MFDMLLQRKTSITQLGVEMNRYLHWRKLSLDRCIVGRVAILAAEASRDP